MNNIYEILKENPTLSICLGFVLAVIIMILFKDVIKEYIRKKYDLYNRLEINIAANKAKINEKFIVENMKPQTNFSDLVLRNLKRIK